MKDSKAFRPVSPVPGIGAPQLVLRLSGLNARAVALQLEALGAPLSAYSIRKKIVDDGLPSTVANQVAGATADFAAPGVHVVATDAVDPTLLAAGARANHAIQIDYVAVLEVWATQAATGTLGITYQVVL